MEMYEYWKKHKKIDLLKITRRREEVTYNSQTCARALSIKRLHDMHAFLVFFFLETRKLFKKPQTATLQHKGCVSS